MELRIMKPYGRKKEKIYFYSFLNFDAKGSLLPLGTDTTEGWAGP
jgi:hypothetical protein